MNNLTNVVKNESISKNKIDVIDENTISNTNNIIKSEIKCETKSSNNNLIEIMKYKLMVEQETSQNKIENNNNPSLLNVNLAKPEINIYEELISNNLLQIIQNRTSFDAKKSYNNLEDHRHSSTNNDMNGCINEINQKKKSSIINRTSSTIKKLVLKNDKIAELINPIKRNSNRKSFLQYIHSMFTNKRNSNEQSENFHTIPCSENSQIINIDKFAKKFCYTPG